MTSILVIDDETALLRALRINLAARDYTVHTASDGTSGLAAMARDHPDVVIVDLGLTDMHGTDLITALRDSSTAPIIVLSARGEEAQKVKALHAGADDYVTKPFDMNELLARLRAATRRIGPARDEPTANIGDFVIDLTAKRVTHRDGSLLRLTPTEWQLLEVLARHRGRLVTSRQLLQQVWGPGYDTETHYLRVYMAQLRRKLEPDPARPRHLLTEPAMGYRLQDENESA
jgi:two-component system, OmpR family, KDP operon response regulator KdpE